MQFGASGPCRRMPDFKYPCQMAGVFAFGAGIFAVAKAAGGIAVECGGAAATCLRLAA